MSDDQTPKALPAPEHGQPPLLPAHEPAHDAGARAATDHVHEREEPEHEHAEADHGHGEPAHDERLRHWLGLGGAIFIAVTALVVLVVVLVKHHHVERVRAERERSAARGPTLPVVRVGLASPKRELTLPGDVRGFNQITLYAKVSGYVRKINVERGEHVKKDQILALLESPENDQQVFSAIADEQVKRRNAQRARDLVVPGVISKMDEDRAEGDYRMARANLLRVSSLKEYELVRAPFDGVVTARYVDPGALVPAATSATMSAEPVVDVADISRVRVFVYVGQDAAPFMRVGDAATLWQDETPERKLTASVTRLASALDQRTRRMLCEIDMDNHDGALLPGTFVHARLSLSVPPSPSVPAEALTVRGGKDLVATVDARGHVHFVPVVPGFTDGREVRVLSGLKGGETVVQVVPADLEEGEVIDAVPAKKNDGAAQQAKPANTANAQRAGAVPSDNPPNFGDTRLAPSASSASSRSNAH